MEFGGIIVAVKGPLIIVQQGIYYFALDTKQLVGRTIEFLEREANMPGQTSLDEWF